MPNRIIKESICTSDTIEQLSWFEEVLFYRLMVKADDFGRYDGRPAIIKGNCFPLKDVTAKDIEKAISKLSAVGLVRMYNVLGRPYLQLTTWGEHQQIRAKKSKFPEMNESDMNCSDMNTSDINCNQMISSDSNCSRNPIQSESKSKSEKKSRMSAREYFADPELNQAFLEFVKMRKAMKSNMTDMAIDLAVKKIMEVAGDNVHLAVEIINQSIVNGWKSFYPLKQDKKQAQNRFHNFEQRDTDYNATVNADMLAWMEEQNG